MGNSLGETICQYRQNKKMTQEEFASRLGVTPQAVSKWERGNGLPDVSLLGGICSILGINADTLLGLTEKVVENGNSISDIEIKTNLIAEPLVLEFSETLIPLISKGLETDYVSIVRKQLAKEKGMLLPILRFRDNTDLSGNQYRVLVYDRQVLAGTVKSEDENAYRTMIDETGDYCRTHYDEIINKHIVKILIDNLKNQYPGVADDLIPEQISYIKIEQKLKEKIAAGEDIKDLIHIIEELEIVS